MSSPFRPDVLAGRTAFVAGGTSGINLAIALSLAEAGARLCVVSRNPEKVQMAREQLSAFGVPASGFAADVRDFAAVDAALSAFHAEAGAIDIVVSGAAGNFLCPANELSANGFRAVVDIDLTGTFHVMRAAYPHLRRPGASIINISAPQSTNVYFGQAHVSAAKAGVDMLTKSLAMEWGPEGIRVNGIVPGPIENTEGMTRLGATPEIREAWRRANPMRRFGQGSEVGAAALFLCTEAASYINGSILHCDGGQVLSGGRDFSSAWAALKSARAAAPGGGSA